MSGGNYSHTTRAVGSTLTSAIYNADHQKHIDNNNPAGVAGQSDDVSAMQAVVDPGGLGSESLASSLAGELQRIRFAIKRIIGEAQWYIAPDSNIAAIVAQGAQYNPGHIKGCTLSNNVGDATNDIDIAAGSVRDDTDAANMVVAALTKRLDAAWAVGTNQGMRDTGSIADGWWYIFAIKRVDTGVVDVLASLSATAPTMPASYTLKRRIGAILRASSAIVAFVQFGDHFLFSAQRSDVATSNPGTSAATPSVSVPACAGISADITVRLYDDIADSQTYALVTSPAQADTAPSSSIFNLHTGSVGGQDFSNTRGFVIPTITGTVRYRLSASTAETSLQIKTNGWYDTRGRD